jgi:hypothetical protein
MYTLLIPIPSKRRPLREFLESQGHKPVVKPDNDDEPDPVLKAPDAGIAKIVAVLAGLPEGATNRQGTETEIGHHPGRCLHEACIGFG